MRTGQLLVGGVWEDTDERQKVLNPYDGSLVGDTAVATREHAERAVDLAAEAHASGARPAEYERADLLHDASVAIRDRAEELARCLAEEAGKPLKAARNEIQRGSDTFEFASLEARKLVGEVIPTAGSSAGVGKLGFTLLRPKGVVGAISPFNFPFNLVCHKLAPAFAAGCPVVLKPSGETPFVALELAKLLIEVGLPSGFLSVLTGPSSEIGPVLTGRDEVTVISFTGSTEVGYRLASDSPKKTVLLELGSNSPVIVDETADLEHAASRVAGTAFSYAGQSCISAQRLYVHESVAAAFREVFVAKIEELRTGDPLDESTDVGPLIRERDRDRIVSWIEEAVAEGAKVRTGGRLNDDGTLPPTVVEDVTPQMKVSCQEIFGPVVAVATYRDFDEAIRLSNDSRYGLHAGLFTTKLDRALRAARELVFGGVTINESPTFRLDQQPYGGVRESGNTREGPAWAVHDYLEETAVLINLP